MSEKLIRLQRALADWQLDGVLLTRRDNIAWLTEGASFYVVERAETGVASLFITQDKVLLLAPENEMPRIVAEEALPFAYEALSFPWFQSLNGMLPLDHFGSDTPQSGMTNIQQSMIALRQGLNANEQKRYRVLGREAAQIVEGVARQLQSGVTEWQVEARIAAACLARGIRPMCILIAADERIAAFKHPVPTQKKLQQQMLITLGAERHGLHVSLTRLVHIGEPEPVLRQRFNALCQIHADILCAMQPGHSWSALFKAIEAAYQQHGHVDAWRDHHQGGPAGYGCRDMIVTPETPGNVSNDSAVAWNPTLKGVKSEDTFLLTVEGCEALTRSGEWPMIKVQRSERTLHFPDWLVLPSSA